jgi:hypothetical protein
VADRHRRRRGCASGADGWRVRWQARRWRPGDRGLDAGERPRRSVGGGEAFVADRREVVIGEGVLDGLCGAPGAPGGVLRRARLGPPGLGAGRRRGAIVALGSPQPGGSEDEAQADGPSPPPAVLVFGRGLVGPRHHVLAIA